MAGLVVGVAVAGGRRFGALALSFTLGALLPLLAILLPPPAWRVPVTFVAVLIALALTAPSVPGSAGAPAKRAVCPGW